MRVGIRRVELRTAFAHLEGQARETVGDQSFDPAYVGGLGKTWVAINRQRRGLPPRRCCGEASNDRNETNHAKTAEIPCNEHCCRSLSDDSAASDKIAMHLVESLIVRHDKPEFFGLFGHAP